MSIGEISLVSGVAAWRGAQRIKRSGA